MKHAMLLSFCMLVVAGLLEAAEGKAEVDVTSIKIVNKTKAVITVVSDVNGRATPIARVKPGDTESVSIEGKRVSFADLDNSKYSSEMVVDDGATYILHPGDPYSIRVSVSKK